MKIYTQLSTQYAHPYTSLAAHRTRESVVERVAPPQAVPPIRFRASSKTVNGISRSIVDKKAEKARLSIKLGIVLKVDWVWGSFYHALELRECPIPKLSQGNFAITAKFGVDMLKKTKWFCSGLVFLFLFPVAAPGQVLIAAKALGMVSHLVDPAHGHETASVLLAADADKVFSTADELISKNPDNEILSKNDGDRSISFNHGGLAISLKVERVQDDLTQILVVSSGKNTPDDTSFVVDGILQVCKKTGAHCWLPNK